MAYGVRPYLVGSVLLGVLGVLAACSGGHWFGQREPWRHDAEVQCLSSGAVKEGAGIVRVDGIRGPGICGADFPLRVSALGDGVPVAYTDELRPPASIPVAPARVQPRWPVGEPRGLPPSPRYDGDPVSLTPPAAAAPPAAGDDPYAVRPSYGSSSAPVVRAPLAAPGDPNTPSYDERSRAVPLGPARAPLTASVGPVSVKPAATLACPIVSALDQWFATSVQPAAMRWFGQPVVEIRQISAYSCRGMNGNPNAHISEHAFGNALDIAAFTLANGRRITVKDGWRGRPEEQGFLRDIQAAACDQFNTVLAPGSNVYHYDHIHVDLMRRASGRRACNPSAVSGEEVAARAGGRYAAHGGGGYTGSIGRASLRSRPFGYADDPRLPIAVPGEDGQD
jgi:hypothetical protein